MSEEKATKKTTKEVKKLKVVRSSIGTQLVFKGEPVILNNGLSQKLLKEMKAAGFKCIVNE
tara:strand:+ start:534 stop:716 length:183 start_codon:yes stop_codon:yes gene_type:complete